MSIEKENEIKNSQITKLEDDTTKKVGGGYVYEENKDPLKPWAVINDATTVVEGRYATKEEAKFMADKKGQSHKRIKTQEELDSLKNVRGWTRI